jgi:hypothetical protein
MSQGKQSSSGSVATTNTNELAGHAVSEAESAVPAPAPRKAEPPREHGGRGGLDPTRYGDWEKNGRCIDF